MYKVVLLRHGQSTWNLENRFTGWTDVDLSEHLQKTPQITIPIICNVRGVGDNRNDGIM